MSDDQLRELERRFRASGSVEDEAAWLRGRMQTGALTSERVELAARLGAPGPRRVLGLESDADLPFDDRLQHLLETLPEASPRCAVVLARRLLPEWERDEVRQQIETNHAHPRTSHGLWTPQPPDEPLPAGWHGWARRFVQAREAALVGGRPDPEEVELTARLEDLPTSPYFRESSHHAEAPLTGLLEGLLLARAGPVGVLDLLSSCILLTQLAQGRRLCVFSAKELRGALTGLAPWRAGAQVLLEELVPWLLGYGDSVQDRVARICGAQPAE